MGGDRVIEVRDVSRKFCRKLSRTMWYGLADLGRNLLGRPSSSTQLRHDEFWALHDVSFDVGRGECLGVIGHNGAGKSTLLKLLSGIVPPDSGSLHVRGRVGALLQVGAGFHPMLTGRENVYVNGTILGLTRRQIDERIDAIVEFAEVGDFLDMPVRAYSSGMFVRLGFAIAAFAEPDIMLVDEVLAVGDSVFQAKCLRRMQGFRQTGGTMLLVSHDLTAVQRVCDRVIVLHEGRLAGVGPPAQMIAEYHRLLDERMARGADERSTIPPGLRGDPSIVCVRNVTLHRSNGQELAEAVCGDPLTIRLHYTVRRPVAGVHFCITFHNPLDGLRVGCATAYDDVAPIDVTADGYVELHIDPLALAAGVYDIDVSIWDADFRGAHDSRAACRRLVVTPGRPMVGRVDIPHRWSVSTDLPKHEAIESAAVQRLLAPVA